jgi:DNA-binding XRE family transcriptional regulator
MSSKITADELYLAIGRAIKAARADRELTQTDLALAIGLTRTSIVNIEQGRQRMPLHTLVAIGDALGIDARDLWPARPKIQADGPWYLSSHSWEALSA